MSVAKASSLTCRGVRLYRRSSMRLRMRPMQLLAPTTKHTIFPSPETTRVPLSRAGEGASFLVYFFRAAKHSSSKALGTGSLSPVMLLSST